jgi:hypothetical protein
MPLAKASHLHDGIGCGSDGHILFLHVGRHIKGMQPRMLRRAGRPGWSPGRSTAAGDKECDQAEYLE